jgi:hypothetical protein
MRAHVGFHLPWLGATLLALGIAATCRAEPSIPVAQAAKPIHKVSTSPATVKIGGQGEATIRFEPAAGFHWNKEYPAKVKLLSEPTRVSLPKLEWKQLAGDFKHGDKDAMLKIAVTGKTKGTESLQAEANYSMCDERTCLIEKATVTLAFEVD